LAKSGLLACVVPVRGCFTSLIQGRVTVIAETTYNSRGPMSNQERVTRDMDSRPAGASSPTRGVCPAVTRPLQVRQWQANGTRTEISAPHRAGLLADRLVDRTCRCPDFRIAVEMFNDFAGKDIVVQEPSVGVSTPEPKILSAIKLDPRIILPGMILNGERSFPESIFSSLRSARTRPPQLGNQPMFRGTLQASSGSDGVDSKTGAAIQRPALPGEPR